MLCELPTNQKMSWFSLFLLCTASACLSLEINTKRGRLQGTEETSRSGRKFYAFRGIPYAQPPVGNLRLKNPQPHNGWEGLLDATKEAPRCTQKLLYFPTLRNVTIGKEDCLYLNIFTPTTDTTEGLPVLVYVHGGGFRLGTSGPKEGPAFFMDEDVVIVTFHYRVGTLGFMSTEDNVIPGNFGLKDQAMVIKWLSENVNDYGGNPKSIVVFGESAGGASVHYLITSPLSKGLLKGGISQSGVIDTAWALSRPGHARKLTDQVASIVGCQLNPLLDCLQSVDVEKLIASELHFVVWDCDPPVVFQPVVEEDCEDAFITEGSLKLRNTLPWITGITNGEGDLKVAGLINQDDSVLNEFVSNIDKILPVLLFIEPSSPGFEQFMAIIKDKYFKNLNDRIHVLEQIGKFYYDFYFIYPMTQALEKHSGPKYVYLYSHRGENSLTDRLGPKKLNSTRASHGDEMLSLFNWSSLYPGSKGKQLDKIVSELLVKLWVNFAKSQNPSLENSHTHWDEYTNNNLLHIQTEGIKMEQISFEDVTEFWSQAYSVLKSPIDNKMKEEL